jgi:hypothetical protein
MIKQIDAVKPNILIVDFVLLQECWLMENWVRVRRTLPSPVGWFSTMFPANCIASPTGLRAIWQQRPGRAVAAAHRTLLPLEALPHRQPPLPLAGVQTMDRIAVLGGATVAFG